MGNQRLWTKCLLFLFFGATALVWSTEVERVEEKTFKMSGDGSVSVMANEGGILIKTWNREEVHLKMTKRAWGRSRREAERLLDEIEVRIQEGRDRLVIRELARRDKDNFNFFDLFDGDFWREKRWRRGSVDFELTVPKRVQLKLQSDEGNVEVRGAEGRLTIDVDEGGVDLADILSTHVQVSVDEGDVSVSGINERGQGFWRIDTDEGSILVEDGAVEEIDLSSDEGEIIFRNVQALRVWLTTDEGDIEADLQPMRGGNYRMEAEEGDIEISIPKDANIRVKLQADEGRIDSDFNLRTRRRDDGEIMEGEIGRDDGVLKAYTEEGDILLIKQ